MISGELSYNKQYATLYGLNSIECQKKHNIVSLSSNQFCAINEVNGQRPCHGDEGGPLLAKDEETGYYYLAGITSIVNENCVKENLPSIFTVETILFLKQKSHFFNRTILRFLFTESRSISRLDAKPHEEIIDLSFIHNKRFFSFFVLTINAFG